VTPPTKTQAIAVIEDLLRKFPLGPTGKLTKYDYVTRERYDTITENYRLLTELGSEMDIPHAARKTVCGYDIHMIMEIAAHVELDNNGSIRTDEWDWRRTLRNLYPELSSKAITSRARRLARRIGQPAYTRWRSGDVAGVYKVQFEYGQDGAVYAYGETAQDAQIVATMMCQHAYAGTDIRSTTLVNLRDVGSITKLNDKTATAIQDDINAKLKKIQQLKEQIGTLETKQGVIATFSGMQIGAMLDALS